MSDARRDFDYLLDIEDAIRRIIAYSAGMDWDAYIVDYKTQDAIVRNLEVIGEATKNISETIRDQYLSIPWKDMANTRDRLIHHYFGIDQEIVWQIVQQDLPVLLKQMENLLDQLPGGKC
jgi:uncharacterized protein with HEPN domain